MQDTGMKTVFLSRLKANIRETCEHALDRNRTIKQSLSRIVWGSDLRPYMERIQACLVSVWRYHSDVVVQRHAAEACDMIRRAVNRCSLSESYALLAKLKDLRIKVHTAFILASCLTHSPLAQGKALTEKWTTYFAPHLLKDQNFMSTLAQANSKQFREAIELCGLYTSKKVRPKREDDIPGIVRAVVDAVFDHATGEEDTNITITKPGAGVDHTNPKSPAEMTLYGTCMTCDMVALGELDTQMTFHCQRCWEQHCLLLQRTNNSKTAYNTGHLCRVDSVSKPTELRGAANVRVDVHNSLVQPRHERRQ